MIDATASLDDPERTSLDGAIRYSSFGCGSIGCGLLHVDRRQSPFARCFESAAATWSDLGDFHVPEMQQSVRDFMAADGEAARADVAARHPDLPERLAEPATRSALVSYLAGEGPWMTRSAVPIVNILAHMLGSATIDDAVIVRPLLMHADADVRLGAYAMLARLAAAGPPEALTALLQAMLMDAHERVREAGASYVDQGGKREALSSFLVRWMVLAGDRDDMAASRARVARLLAP